jgi:hypothetical protein
MNTQEVRPDCEKPIIRYPYYILMMPVLVVKK